jgi:lactoylglutathione lyase
VEIVERDAAPPAPAGAPAAAALPPYFTYAQTMLRVRDPAPSLAFYCGKLRMTLLRATHADTFSIYFLATLPGGSVVPDPASPEAREYVKRELYPRCVPILELTHNHGTEKDPSFVHFNGNEAGRRGFGHTGFLVPDVYAFSAELESAGVPFHKKPDEGSMKGLAFAKDPVRPRQRRGTREGRLGAWMHCVHACRHVCKRKQSVLVRCAESAAARRMGTWWS